MNVLTRSLALSLFPLLASLAHADVDAVALLRAGLGPGALAAAGVTAQEAGAAVADVRASDAATNGDLAAADAACRSANKDCGALAKKVRGGDATSQEKADYHSAKAALAQAEATRQAVLDDLFAAGIADLSTARKATLTQTRANIGRRGFPTELLVVSRTDKEWIDLRACLQHEQVCLKDGEAVHETVAAKLATLRAVSAVSKAKANLDANLASIETAWNEAVSG